MGNLRDKILTIQDVTKLRGCSAETVRVAIRKGKLKATFFHGEWHIRESNLYEYEKGQQSELRCKKLVTLGEASTLLKISKLIILRAARTGRIEVQEDSLGFKISLKSLLEWERMALGNLKSYR